MPQQIKVAEVFTKPTKKGGLFVKITDDKGGTFSGFDENLAKLNKGDVIQAEIEIQGQYTNIKSWTAVERQEPPKAESSPAPSGKPPATYGAREASIETQVAVKEIGLQRANGKPVPEDCEKAYWGWIRKALGIQEAEAQKTTLVKAVENLTGAKAEEMITIAQRAELIKHKDQSTEIIKYMASHFNKMKSAELTKAEADQLLEAIKSGKLSEPAEIGGD